MLKMRSAARVRGGARIAAAVVATTMLVVALPAVATLPAAAAPPAAAPTGGGERSDQLQDAIGEASVEEARALTQLQQIQSQRATIDTKIKQLAGQIASTQARARRHQAEADKLHLEADRIGAKVRATDAKLQIMKAQAVSAAVAIYRGDGDKGAYSELLDAGSLQDAYTGGVYLRHVAKRRLSVAEQLKVIAQQLQGQKREAERKQAAADAARRAAADEASQLGGLKAEQSRQRDLVAVQEYQEARIVKSIQQRKASYEAELATLQASSSDISRMLYSRQRSERRGEFVMKVRPVNAPITSPFGSRFHPILHIWRMHTGVDLGAAYGTPVKAVADGVVVSAGAVNGYGNCVIVDHGNQYATLYAHASAVEVSAGEKVKAGDVLMKSGNSGLSTGPHLHFEVRLLGTPIDPAQFF
jgi:peptidoglycan DL-endopeptidase CwlO